MYFGLATVGPSATDPNTTVVATFAHNMSNVEMKEVHAAASAELKPYGLRLIQFTHALRHDDGTHGFGAEGCAGCAAALNETLDIAEERRAADEQRIAASQPQAPPSP